MKKSVIILTTTVLLFTASVFTAKAESTAPNNRSKVMKVTVTANEKTTVFQLNNSTAAKELYAQLPLTIKVEDFGGKEKIFYPPKKLDTEGTPPANAKAGSLSYYAPWGDVVMFYKDFGSASGLFELGKTVKGAEHIIGMSGTIHIDKSE